jgi:hypothetical protein
MEENKNIEPEQPPENIPKEIIPSQENILPEPEVVASEQQQTTNPQPQREEMEIHHPHHVTHKKKWGEYLLEFFMLFLAVFLGFVAENVREENAKKHKEKDYIETMVEDLKTDSAFLQLSITKLIPYHVMWMDSTIHLFEMPDLTKKDRLIYQAYFLGTAWTYNFHPTERTLTQLRSDGFHLIKNKRAAKAISQLEDQYKIYAQMSGYINNLQNNIDLASSSFADRNTVDKIGRITFVNFNNDPFVHLELKDIPESATIKTSNKERLKTFLEKLNDYAFYTQAIKNEYVILLNSVKNTLDVLKREYHLENE